jgi:hypothetical protein
VRWSGRRIALSLLALVLVCGAIAGGYALGSTGVADQRQAQTERQDSARVAFLAARDAAFKARLVPGRRDGRETGTKEGAGAGARRGQVAGRLAADNAAHPSGHNAAPSGVATGRSETESEIGGIGGGGGSVGSGSVLVVGDSLEVLTSPYLKQYLPGVHLTVNAVGGYSSLQIFELFRQSYDPSQNVIVFDAGTNDNPNYPEILAGRLQAVASIVGNQRCMVVPTIHGLSVDGVDSTGKNHVVRAFAASRPGTQTPDWAGFEASHPELMQPDDLHPIAAGAQARARLIAQGVRRCLAYQAALAP